MARKNNLPGESAGGSPGGPVVRAALHGSFELDPGQELKVGMPHRADKKKRQETSCWISLAFVSLH